MITETQTRIIVLQLTNALFAQLQPFLAGLDITACTAEHTTQRLTMRSEVYELLAERVGGALDYEVRWQPNVANRAEVACTCGQTINLE